MKYTHTISGILILLLTSVTNANNTVPILNKKTQNQKTFVLLDSIKANNKPDLASLGFLPIRMIPSAVLWTDGKLTTTIDRPQIQSFMRQMKKNHQFIYIDVEHLPFSLDNLSEFTDSQNTLIAIFDEIKPHHPTAKMGFYSVPPVREFYGPVRCNTRRLTQWRQKNGLLYPLAKKVDVLYPSLYAFSSDIDHWKSYAIANINEAKQYGKTIYAFIWPEYHPSVRKNNEVREFVSYDYWYAQLEMVYQQADGVVIWTPSAIRFDWNENAPWWLATKDFIAKHGLSSTHNAAATKIDMPTSELISANISANKANTKTDVPKSQANLAHKVK